MNSRALLVTVVAPSKRPVALCYYEGRKEAKQRTLGNKNFVNSEGILVLNCVARCINRPPASVDNNYIFSDLLRNELSKSRVHWISQP